MGNPPPSNQPQPPAWTNLVLFIPIMVVMYLILIRPQQKKTRELNEMLKSVRAGDKIVTSGGIVAVVVTVKENSLTVRSADAKFEVRKSAVAEITERSGESNQS